jgi:hypothetical protein
MRRLLRISATRSPYDPEMLIVEVVDTSGNADRYELDVSDPKTLEVLDGGAGSLMNAHTEIVRRDHNRRVDARDAEQKAS